MAYRGDQADSALQSFLENLETRVRRLEETANPIPDPGWVLVDAGDAMHYLYVPTGATGPDIGIK